MVGGVLYMWTRNVENGRGSQLASRLRTNAGQGIVLALPLGRRRGNVRAREEAVATHHPRGGGSGPPVGVPCGAY